VVALLERFVADGLGQEGLAHAERAHEEHIVVAADEVAGSQFVDLFAGDGGVEAPVKVVQRLELAANGESIRSAEADDDGDVVGTAGAVGEGDERRGDGGWRFAAG